MCYIIDMKLTKSPRINKALYDIGISTYFQVIEHLPRRYENMAPTHEFNLEDKARIVFRGRIVSSPTLSRFRNLTLSRFTFLTEKNNLFKVEAWNRPYLRNILNSEIVYLLIGYYDKKKNIISMSNITRFDSESKSLIKPVYSLPRSVDNYIYAKLVKRSFEAIDDEIYNYVPRQFMEKYRLIERKDALRLVHEPNSESDVKSGLRVLKYEECLSFSLKTQLIRDDNKGLVKNERQHIDERELDNYVASLPYALTSSQKQSVKEIMDDMNKQSLMYRLLQGDVGTGKTLVAAIALYGNWLRNDQGALMAPTDALARQHFLTLHQLFKSTDIKIALLVGATPLKERRQICNALSMHKIDVIVGTHALFSKDVNYDSLGLAIIDEQHRFGVNQRLLLANKGTHADLLLMSATPIPRTLSMTVYGDLDVSTLKEFPFQERRVSTTIVSSNDERIYRAINESLSERKKIFIIAPLIDEGESDRISVERLFARYLLKYPMKVALLHGKMPTEEKNSILKNFYDGTKPILVSTSVIEVGIDVKDANLMIVYEPESFGLASLHQLRGRIGRDGNLSRCLLIYDGIDEEEKDKLNVLVKSNDGFFIAEEDLRRRGPGEITGVKQSGLPNFTFVNLINDIKMFEVARDDATYIISHSDEKSFKYVLKKARDEIDRALGCC